MVLNVKSFLEESREIVQSMIRGFISDISAVAYIHHQAGTLLWLQKAVCIGG